MQKILVNKSFLPDFDEYTSLLKTVWETGFLTNAGPLAVRLEQELQKYLENKNLCFVSNGTVALQIAIKALNLKDEVITTPFSYVATTSSIVWEHCKPVFVDIDPQSLNIDVTKIEDAITEKTTGILATHVYGNPCDVEAIEAIAKKFNLKVIYDAAHAFGVKYKNKFLTNYGDLSTLSFHATKVFHTVEGGAIVSKNAELNHKVSYLRNFGHNGPEEFFGIGINGKNSEFHAAMGLCNLPKIKAIISDRKRTCELYDSLLKPCPSIKTPVFDKNTTRNYSYYPVIFPSELILKKTIQILTESNIFPRRYFYPALNTLSYLPQKVSMPMAEDISKRILCLPLYFNLESKSVNYVSEILLKALSL